jgi:chloramphenicol-sensitive protein RarD
VNNGHIVETSLGYFILPLLNVALGVLVLKERMRRCNGWPCYCAAVGVAIEATRAGGLPWIALVLAGTFGIYGLLRKQLPLDAASGLFLETVCMTPLALAWLGWLAYSGQRAFRRQRHAFDGRPAAGRHRAGHGDSAAAVRDRRAAAAAVNMMAFLQYMAPTIAFLIGVLVYHEPLDPAHAEPGRDLGRARGV